MPLSVRASARRSPVQRAAFGTVAIAVVDFGSKGVAGAVLPHQTVLTNADLSLGIAGGEPWLLVGLMAAGVVAASTTSTWALRTGRVPWWPVALLLGGAIGNLVDRAAYGSVRDFVPLGPIVINAADVAVLMGLLTVAFTWQPPQRGPNRATSRTFAQREGGDDHDGPHPQSRGRGDRDVRSHVARHRRDGAQDPQRLMDH